MARLVGLKRLVFAVASVGLAGACGGKGVSLERQAKAMSAVIPQDAGKALAVKRIYFGHQSVGYNLIEGLQSWAAERPDLGLKIVESKSADGLAGPAFMHAKNGANYEPFEKMQDFSKTLEAGVGEKADVAFFKFCYVDFSPETDVEKVFAGYKQTLASLHGKYPKTKFLHVTVPLTIVQSGPKATLKKLLGKKLGGAEANVVRNRFNDLMRKEYGGREPLFDLAAVESTRPDGLVRFDQDGTSYPALAPEYSSDGKHLNTDGARWASAHLLKTLAELP
jgi:hypothetical protein